MKLEDLEAKLGIANMGEEEKLALVKDIQANIPALKAEQRLLEAKTQANLVVEAIKKIKEGLEARFDELNGIVDVKVRDITSGKDGLQGPKGDRGSDGTNGKDGYNGKDGIDGVDGKDGVGVQDAYIDFDGSLVIKLTDGKELNVGEVVPMDVAEKIKVIGNGGGTSQSVLDSIAAINTTIATYGTMATQNANSVAITGGTINGTTVGATTPSTGAFTTLSASSTVSGTGFSTYLASPPAIGGTTAAAGTFTTLTATSTGTFGGDATAPALVAVASAGNTRWLSVTGSSAGNVLLNIAGAGNGNLVLIPRGTGAITFATAASATNVQMSVTNTASAVNYIQVTGAATGAAPVISVQGSDANRGLDIQAKGTGTINFGSQRANYLRVDSASASNSPVFSAQGSDTDIDLTLTPKGAGNIRFGTYTAGVLTPTGYITVKDSGGTTRRLLVG